ARGKKAHYGGKATLVLRPVKLGIGVQFQGEGVNAFGVEKIAGIAAYIIIAPNVEVSVARIISQQPRQGSAITLSGGGWSSIYNIATFGVVKDGRDNIISLDIFPQSAGFRLT